MRIVITGGTGLIGSRLTANLLAVGHEVWSVSRTRPTLDNAIGLHWVPADLAAAGLPTGLPERADAIVHLAQSAHYRDFPECALDVFNVNIGSTARLLHWGERAGVRHFILASSGGVVGDATPHSHYIASKRSAELLATSYASLFRVLVLRFFFVYGAGQKPGMLVPRLIRIIQSEGEIALAGVDGPRVNPIFVEDAVRAVERAIEVGTAGTIDIAGPEVLTIRAMSEAIAEKLGRQPRFACDPAAVPQDLVGDIASMSAQLTAPRCLFADGVSELIPLSLRA